MDFSALLYDPVYAALGVPARFTPSGDATTPVDITVIDDTRKKSMQSGSLETRSVDPGAFARIPELTAKGINKSQWRGSLAFNGSTWKIRNYDVLGSPNGENMGEVRFELKEHEDT